MANESPTASNPLDALASARKAVAEVNEKRDKALLEVAKLNTALEKAEADLTAARAAVSATIA